MQPTDNILFINLDIHIHTCINIILSPRLNANEK